MSGSGFGTSPQRKQGLGVRPSLARRARQDNTSAVAVLFALEREAAPFRRMARDLRHVSVHVTGVGHTAARTSAERILGEEPEPRLVIAAGFCGALAPHLKVGDVVTSPRIATAPHLVATPAEKRRLAAESGAHAVDMESAAVAGVCAAKGIPFLAVRAVSDTVDTALSPELVRLLAGGRVSAWKAGVALVRKPALVGEFRRLARDTKLAARKLAEELAHILGERGREPPVD